MNLVAIPVVIDSLKITVDQGRFFSAIEHAILFSLTKKSQSAVEIAQRANLPKRIIVSAIIRLMQVGWVDVLEERHAIYFRSTELGLKAASKIELPAQSEPKTFWIKYALDLYTSAVFNARELFLKWKNELSVNTIVLPHHINDSLFPDAYIIEQLLNANQKLVKVNTEGAHRRTKYCVFRLEDGNIDDLPVNAPDGYSDSIALAVEDIQSKNKCRVVGLEIAERGLPNLEFDVLLKPDDIIMGGKQNKLIFESSIEKAQEKLIILSTFLHSDCLDNYFEGFKSAALRNVEIYILWGKDGSDEDQVETKDLAGSFRKRIKDEGLERNITILPYSVRSHAKILIADDGCGNLFTVMGSCNWLATKFLSCDASIRVRDGVFTGQVIAEIERMVSSPGAHRSSIAIELTRLALTAKSQTRMGESNSTLKLVLGSEHNDMMLKARDSATSNITVQSHRLSSTAQASIVEPCKASVKSGVNIELIYERFDKSYSDDPYFSNLVTELSGCSILIKQIDKRKGRAHAKLLLWDNDNAVITSHNWMSRDPADKDKYSEMGVYISKVGICSTITESKAYKALNFKIK